MSSQDQTDRRDRSRFARKQWVPTGSPSVQSPSGSISSHRISRSRLNNYSSKNSSEQLHAAGLRKYNRQGQRDGLQCKVAASSNLNGTCRGKPPNHRREKGASVEKDEERVERRHFADEGKRLMKWKNNDVPERVQGIQDKLMKGTIECMICCDRIRRTAPIWSCKGCYAVLHLNCTKKWARAPTSSDSSVETSQGFNWRCPLCQSVQLTASKEIRYACFCRKRQDPPSDLYLTPHSCGEPCGKQLEKELPEAGVSKEDLCPHVCVLQCHPGPCLPCKAFAPPRMCPCGKKLVTTRCSDRKSTLTCGQTCGKKLDCERHCCERVCHVGPCDPCKVPLGASCFCTKKTETLLCGEISVKGKVVVEGGLFACGSSCGKKLSCGNHLCIDPCHPGPCGECELVPSKVRACHCGKTLLPQDKRTSCLDPIPTCSKICGKSLPCRMHHCPQVCHEGDCPPCLERVNQKCRCGSTSRIVDCNEKTSGNVKFVCDKPCGKKKNCKRHRCSERCCPLSTLPSNCDPHFCSIVCGKKLQCGQHSCQSPCHSGHCPPCLETIFTDLTCACGKTSIPPPLPCGTSPPSCQHSCSVPQPCGHPSSHTCHFGDCPPCTVLVAKECAGGHVVLRNIPCASKGIQCSNPCGKTRQCGIHGCGRACHSPPCDSSCRLPGSVLKPSCGQMCGAPRRNCKHTCTAPCHPSTPCPDSRCQVPMTITCSCGRVTTTVPCDFSALGHRKLACDDECAKAERKRVLADAFNISQHNLDAGAIPDALRDIFRRDPKWVSSVEERCKHLVLAKRSKRFVHVFCPMVKEKRDAVRLIAERWKLTVTAAGSFMVVHATAKSKAPARTIIANGSAGLNPPIYNALVDMDPRLVVALLDVQSGSDISAPVSRFGGECEHVWLDDTNAVAVFGEPGGAATAMRRLDRGSVYRGAAVGGCASGSNPLVRADPWGRGVMRGSKWEEGSWGDEEWSSSNGGKQSAGLWVSSLECSDEVADDWEKAYE